MEPKDIAQLVGSIVGLTGGILGIVSWKATRKIQKHTLGEIESKRINAIEEDSAYEEILKFAGPHVHSKTWNPEIGSKEFKVLERLVGRGKLFRNDFGGYSLRPPKDWS